jgi:hypothetical protein
MRPLLTLTLFAAIGCPSPSGPGPGTDDWAASLTRESGCADLLAFAARPDDTLALVVQVEGLVAAAYEAGEATETTFDLATATDLTVELRGGEHVTHTLCNDAFEFETVISTRHAAVSGTATFVVTPTGEEQPWDAPADATITLSDVVLETEDGDAVELPAFTLSANVGWLPG